MRASRPKNEYTANLSRIEFAVTLACTGSCIHCQNGEGLDRRSHIDADVAKDAITRISAFYEIDSVMTFGGEPLLYPETVCAIHETARICGIPRRQLITNGYFSKRASRVEEVAASLARAGVNELLLSVDAFHQENIPLDVVMAFAGQAVSSGIPVTLSPAWLVNREDPNPYNVKTHALIDAFFKMEGVSEGKGNIVFPGGNALKYLGQYFSSDNVPQNPYTDDPRDLNTVSFCANGDVLDGNIYKTDILELLENYSPPRQHPSL